MSDLRPSTPTRRPESVRPRREGPPPQDPPTAAELRAIERHLLELPVHSGATVRDDAGLGAVVVTAPGTGPGSNVAGAIRWSTDWAARLEGLEASFRDAGQWPSVLLVDGLYEPPDLAQALLGRGWVELDRETVLWSRRPAVVPHLDPTLRIEAVTPRNAEPFEALEREIFGLPSSQLPDRLDALRATLGAGRLRAYMVRVSGEAVATARLSVGTQVAGLYGIGVAMGHRRHGLGTLVTTVATRAGLATGARLVWLSVEDTNAAARAMYGKIGYEPAFRWRRLLGPAPAEGSGSGAG